MSEMKTAGFGSSGLFGGSNWGVIILIIIVFFFLFGGGFRIFGDE